MNFTFLGGRFSMCDISVRLPSQEFTETSYFNGSVRACVVSYARALYLQLLGA
jgi:hypothetical protein